MSTVMKKKPSLRIAQGSAPGMALRCPDSELELVVSKSPTSTQNDFQRYQKSIDLSQIPEEFFNFEKHPNAAPFVAWLKDETITRIDNIIGTGREIPGEPAIWLSGVFNVRKTKRYLLDKLQKLSSANVELWLQEHGRASVPVVELQARKDALAEIHGCFTESNESRYHGSNFPIPNPSVVEWRDPFELSDWRPSESDGRGLLTYNISGGRIAIDAHIDAGCGLSATTGFKLWLWWPPTEVNIAAYFEVSRGINRVATLLGKLYGGKYCLTRPGNCVFIPEGWIHATYALEPGMVVGKVWPTMEGTLYGARRTAQEIIDAEGAAEESIVWLMLSMALSLGVDLTGHKSRKKCKDDSEPGQGQKDNNDAKLLFVINALETLCPMKLDGHSLVEWVGLDTPLTDMEHYELIRAAIIQRLPGISCSNCKSRISDHWPRIEIPQKAAPEAKPVKRPRLQRSTTSARKET